MGEWLWWWQVGGRCEELLKNVNKVLIRNVRGPLRRKQEQMAFSQKALYLNYFDSCMNMCTTLRRF